MDYTDRLAAYFTVEATMVLPIVFYAIYFTVCSLFFRYDRSLMEQDAGVLLLRGSTGQYQSAKFATNIQEQAASISGDKYVLWEQEGFQIELRADAVSVECDGRLGIPMVGDFLGGIEFFECQTKRASQKINPKLFIRGCNKLRED